MSNIETPNVCDIVEYGLNSFSTEPQRWRVSGWLKPYEPDIKDDGYVMATSGAMIGEMDQDQLSSFIVGEIFAEDKLDEPKDQLKLEWCKRNEATHLALTGLCGAIAPVEECTFIKQVEWTQDMIEQHIQSANALAERHPQTHLVTISTKRKVSKHGRKP